MNATYNTPHQPEGRRPSGPNPLHHQNTPELGKMDFDIPDKVVHKIPFNLRNHIVAMVGEFVGTFLFLFFAFAGTQVANNIDTSAGLTVKEAGGANPQQLQYIALSFGFSLAVNAWVFFRISGGLFNPAVTIGMALIGALPPIRAVLLFFTEIVAGIAASAVCLCLFPGPLNVQTSLAGGTSTAQGVFIEMFLSAQLIVTIFMLAAEKHKGTFIAPVGIGLALFIAELGGVYYTGGSLNPARSFGPAVVGNTWETYHWIYWIGPIAGAIIAAGFYRFVKFMEYETANPGQDVDEATEIEKKRQLLMDAGLNPVGAHRAATDLVDNGRSNSITELLSKGSQSNLKGSPASRGSGETEKTFVQNSPPPVPPMPTANSPLHPGYPQQGVGEAVADSPTRNRFARTISSGV